MGNEARIKHESGHGPQQIESPGVGAEGIPRASAGDVKSREVPARTAQVAMIRVTRVSIFPGDLSSLTDINGKGTRVEGYPRPGSVKRRDSTVGSAQKTVPHDARVIILTQNRAIQSNVISKRCEGAGRVNWGEGAVTGAQKA